MKKLPEAIDKSVISIALILLFGMATVALAELPDPGMTITHGNTALVITDPQNDFLSPKGYVVPAGICTCPAGLWKIVCRGRGGLDKVIAFHQESAGGFEIEATLDHYERQ